jgi:hypothetical protein
MANDDRSRSPSPIREDTENCREYRQRDYPKREVRISDEEFGKAVVFILQGFQQNHEKKDETKEICERMERLMGAA